MGSRVREGCSSWYQELCPALFWARSKIPDGGPLGLWLLTSRGSAALVDPAEGHLVEQGAREVLGEDGISLSGEAEWQEILPGSGLGRTVPRSRETGQGRTLESGWWWRLKPLMPTRGEVQRVTATLHPMGTVPSLSSWAIVLPEQARWAEARTLLPGAPLDYTEPCQGGHQASWGLLPVLGYPQRQAQLKGDVRSFRSEPHMPWVNRNAPQWPGEVRALGGAVTGQARKPTTAQRCSLLPSLPGQRPRFTSGYRQHPAAAWEASGRRPGSPMGLPLPSPVHRAPEGLE